MNMLDGIDTFRKGGEKIHLIQDEDGHWTIEERRQQKSDIRNIEPLVIHIGETHRDYFATHEREDISHPNIGIIGIGDTQRELIDVLQHIVAEEGDRQIIIVGGISPEKERKELTLGDFAEKLMEEARREIFRIENTLDDELYNEVYVNRNIKKMNKGAQKYARHYHKFHNQKPSGPKGIYGNSRHK